MTVKCEITEYSTEPGKYTEGKITLQSVLTQGDMVDIVVDGKPHRVSIAELVAAAQCCKLGPFGR